MLFRRLFSRFKTINADTTSKRCFEVVRGCNTRSYTKVCCTKVSDVDDWLYRRLLVADARLHFVTSQLRLQSDGGELEPGACPALARVAGPVCRRQPVSARAAPHTPHTPHTHNACRSMLPPQCVSNLLRPRHASRMKLRQD